MEIRDGEFYGQCCVNNIEGEVTIYGGTFNTVNGDHVFAGEDLTIWGGTFSNDVSEYCADGYCAQPEDNMYVVAEHSYKTVVTAPTATENGAIDYVCSVCGAEYSESTIPVNFTVTEENRSMVGFTGESEETLVIPAVFENDGVWYRVTSIGDHAFLNCMKLKNVIIPDSVVSIGDSAFEECISLTNITIPNSATSIGSSAFKNCFNLTSIALPDNITSISSTTFEGCESLTSITIPDGVTYIDVYAFDDCIGLTTITLPNSVTVIDNGAFTGCESLVSINIPDGVTSIGVQAFYDCSSLTSVTIGNGVTSIGSSAFEDCSSLTNVTIGDSVTSIGNYAFEGCSSLTSVTIPDSVMRIGDYAFAWCSNLTSITIPDSVESIGGHAFEGCSSLTSITIPDGVTSIGDSAFYNCSSLTSITFEGTVEQWTDIRKDNQWNGGANINGILCSDGAVCLTHIEVIDEAVDPTCTETGLTEGSHCETCEETLVAQEIIDALGHDSTFTVTAPTATEDGVIDYVCSVCGDEYSETINPKSFSIDSGNRYMAGITGTEETLIIPAVFQFEDTWYRVTEIFQTGFQACDNLVSVFVPESVTTIGNLAFAFCGNLTSVTISDGVKHIGEGAFMHCYKLSSITIPNGVTAINEAAFASCYSLTSVTFEGTVEQWGTVLKDDAWNEGADITAVICSNGVVCLSHAEAIDAAVDATCTETGLTEGKHCSVCNEVLVAQEVIDALSHEYESTVTAPTATEDGVIAYTCANCGDDYAEKIIPENFTVTSQNRKKIGYTGTVDENLVIPAVFRDGDTWYRVTSIGGDAFSYCKLTSVTIPNSVTSIGNQAFVYCKSLTYVAIPDSVTSIGYNAFMDCESLTSIIVPNSVTSIGNHAFFGCSRLMSITMSENLKSIDMYTFYGCSNMTSITIPDSVTSIGESAFDGCTGLTSITIGDSVTSIGEYAFHDCSNLTDVYYSGAADEWALMAIDSGNNCLTNATIHFAKENRIDGFLLKLNQDGQSYSIVKYDGSEIDVIIPATYKGKPITGIGPEVFLYNTVLKSVTIPDSVNEIGSQAFYGCTSLTNISIPDSVTCIASDTFAYCSSLTNIIIPDGVTSIGSCAFRNCTGLTSIVIPDSVLIIYAAVFYECTGLTSITISDSVEKIDMHVFYDCTALTDVYYAGTEEEWAAVTIEEMGNEILLNATIHYNWIGEET